MVMIGIMVCIGILTYFGQWVIFIVLLLDDAMDSSKVFLALLIPYGFIYLLIIK